MIYDSILKPVFSILDPIFSPVFSTLVYITPPMCEAKDWFEQSTYPKSSSDLYLVTSAIFISGMLYADSVHRRGDSLKTTHKVVITLAGIGTLAGSIFGIGCSIIGLSKGLEDVTNFLKQDMITVLKNVTNTLK